MKRVRIFVCNVAMLAFVVAAFGVQDVTSADDWPRFRGPNGTGVVEAALPTEWSADKNLLWSIDMPGYGSSSPIILGDNLYITCYTGYGIDAENPGSPSDLQRHLICMNKNSGEEVWRSTVDSTNDEDAYQGFITEHGFASSTPATDGEHIFCFFGKTGAVAFDLEGNQVWNTNLGTFSDPYKWGGGGPSPLLYKDLVIINAGIVGHQIVALNKADGEVAWKIEDSGFTNSWTTPILVNTNGRDELVASMPSKVMGINPENGEVFWTAASPLTETTCASLGEHEGIVVAMGGRGGVAVAVQCGGEGDVSATHTAWQEPLRAGIGTPVVVDGNLYWNARGIAYCADCETGEVVFEDRLPAAAGGASGQRRPGGSYGSPIVAGGHVYLQMRDGTMHVLKAGDSLEVVASNSFGEENGLFSATPAVSGDQLYIRSNQKLYCVKAE
ncbi:MAG: PQQ-binding-like beta-propeller repeat protein [Planctomycetota bacterium]